jgi:putative membrane protein
MEENTKHDEHIMEDLSRPSTAQEYIRIFLSGFAMGSADIVPGVSGGTMAFILGIYETLINGIKSFNIEAIKKTLAFFSSDEGKPKNKPSLMDIVDHLHLRFLIALGFGLITAVIALSSLLEGWLSSQPTYIFAFFAGLIIASVFVIGLKVKWSIGTGISLLIGALVAFFITNPELGTLGDTFGNGPLVLFISGAIAICAMILPGISGSFILLILGQYDFILRAVKERDVVSILFVGAGAGIGILIFSRILSWLLKRYENVTIALLVGFMVGSMRLIIFRATNLINEETNEVTAIRIETNQIIIAAILALVGFVIVNLLDHMQTQNNPLFRIFGSKAVEVIPVED